LPRVSGVCGVAEGNAGGTVNTVNVVEYSVQQIAQPIDAAALAVHGLQASMASIVAWDNGALAQTTGENTRMDLLRREIDATGAVIPNSGEVIAEWVADFKLRAWFTQGAGALSNQLFDTGFDKADANPGAEPPQPQRIRSLGIRLTTRSREPDREARAGAAPGPTAPLDRFEVFPAATPRKNRMARVRTMYADVSLPNLANASW
jgi:hypothetical protein